MESKAGFFSWLKLLPSSWKGFLTKKSGPEAKINPEAVIGVTSWVFVCFPNLLEPKDQPFFGGRLTGMEQIFQNMGHVSSSFKCLCIHI